MTILMSAGLLLGTLAGGEHLVRLDHAHGEVQARYLSRVEVVHKQVGNPGPAGRPSSLRCLWAAHVTVHREAQHPRGGTMSRQIAAPAPLRGSRPGWCSTQKGVIAAEVARRVDEVRKHVLAVAEADRPVLMAEIDRLHGTVQGS